MIERGYLIGGALVVVALLLIVITMVVNKEFLLITGVPAAALMGVGLGCCAFAYSNIQRPIKLKKLKDTISKMDIPQYLKDEIENLQVHDATDLQLQVSDMVNKSEGERQNQLIKVRNKINPLYQ